MTDRRYDEDEVRRIFDEASRAVAESSHRRDASQGLSLEELKQIGGDVGLPPAVIEHAARALDHAPSGPALVRDFGLPVTVGRSVLLPREPTEEEWTRLVALARRTFNAKGQMDPTGRYWWNGNLSMSVEPVTDGYRLSLRTTKGDGRTWNRIGLGALALGLGGALVGGITGDPGLTVSTAVMGGGYGILSLLINAIRLPRWASRRSEQMELLATRAVDILSEPPREK